MPLNDASITDCLMAASTTLESHNKRIDSQTQVVETLAGRISLLEDSHIKMKQTISDLYGIIEMLQEMINNMEVM